MLAICLVNLSEILVLFLAVKFGRIMAFCGGDNCEMKILFTLSHFLRCFHVRSYDILLQILFVCSLFYFQCLDIQTDL